jgi:SAM-dependent methyltransferase
VAVDLNLSDQFIDPHLNVAWLRPESALWDAIASALISQFEFVHPSLDFGCGNGIFSFITAGGDFSTDFDWYRNVNPEGFWENRDIYDTFQAFDRDKWIIRAPRYEITVGGDAKINLLLQANGLDFYKHAALLDGNGNLPFENESFETVFSNILFWLKSPQSSLAEIQRILRPGGRALLCLQDPRFKEYCRSYRWRELQSELLRLVNRGRSESHLWTVSYDELMRLAETSGFRVAFHSYYISPLTMKVWDIGLRPLSPLLLKMIRKLSEEDRKAIKTEWMETLRPFVRELWNLDVQNTKPGGFHFVCLEKK